MAQPASHEATLPLRVVSLIFSLVSLILLVIKTEISTSLFTTYEDDDYVIRLSFQAVHTYRYMVAASVICIAYDLLQITIFSVSRIMAIERTDGCLLFDFYGDMVVSYMLVAGAAAGIGVTRDLWSKWSGYDLENFFIKGYESVCLLLLAFVCSAMLSIMSSYALRKQV